MSIIIDALQAGFTVEGIFTRIDFVLNDKKRTRWTREERILWINDGIREIIVKRPNANMVTAKLALVAGALQTLPFGAFSLSDITRNVRPDNTFGKAIRLADMQLLIDQDPKWFERDEAFEIRHYCHDERNPKRFYNYPPCKAGTVVEAVFYGSPADVTKETDPIPLGIEYMEALLSYALYRCCMKDVEYADNGVATLHWNAFNTALMGYNAGQAATTPNQGSV